MANKYSQKYHTKPNFSNYLFLGLLLVMIVVTIYFANFMIKKAQVFEVSASSGKAELFFEPANLKLAQEGQLNLWVTTDKSLGFVSTQLTFDKTVLKLTQEPVLPSAALTQIIKVTPMAEANNTGIVEFVVAVKPSTVTIAPTGTFSLVSLKFAPKISTPNISSTLSLSPSNIELVDLSATPFIVTTQPATFSINPVVATPSPSVAPTTVPTPVPSPPQTNLDYMGPSLKLTKGKNWRGYWVTAKASDVSGINQISVSKPGSVINVCNKKTTCTLYVPTKYARPYDVVVTATDNSAQRNSSTSTITVK